MPAEVYKLVLDNAGFQKGLKDSEAQAAASTGVISASLTKMGDGGAAGSKGIHLVNDSLKMTRSEINESKGSIAMLGEMLGVHIPRHARGLIASLDMIGPALNTAFNAVAVVAIGMAFVEAGKKLYEFFEKAHEAEEKAKSDNDEFAQSLNKSNLELAVQVDKVEKHIAQLERKPYNGLKASLDEAALSAFNLAQKLDTAIQKERALLQGQDNGWLGKAWGTEGTGPAQDKLNAYNTGQNDIDIDYQNQLDQAKRLGATKEQIDALELRYLQAKAAFTVSTYNIIRDELKLRKEYAKLSSEGAVSKGSNSPEMLRWDKLNTMFGGQADQSKIIPAMQNMMGNLGMTGHGQQSEADLHSGKVTEGNDEEANRMAGLTKEAQRKAVAILKADMTERFKEIYKDLQEQLEKTKAEGRTLLTPDETWNSLQEADGKSEKQQKDTAENQKRAATETYKAALAAIEADEKLVEEQLKLAVQNGHLTKEQAAAKLKDVHDSAWDKKQEAFGTAQNNGMGASLADATSRQGQRNTEQLQDKNATDPFAQLRTIQDQFLTGLNSNITNLLTGEKTNWASFLKQLSSSLISKGLNSLTSLIPHFADGGYTGTGAVLVGEKGPEIFNPGSGGTVTPNHKLVSGSSSAGAYYTINVASGVSKQDFADTLQQALKAVHGQTVEDAGNIQSEKRARTPRGAW
jgi:hypothetical protein